MPQTAALLALLALAASSSSLTASSAVSSSLSRYRVVSNQQWPSCCIRPKPGCVGPPTLPNQSMVNLPDFAKWHIEPNPGLTFNGPVVATLYSFGRIPRYTGMGPDGACHDGDWNCTNATAVFGGLPQLANLTAHLQQLRKDIEYSFPDPDWNGLAAVDFEDWKPVFMTDVIEGYFHHNLDIYVNRSIELARQRHPAFTEEELVVAAADEFNAASQIFWNASFALCKRMRPHGRFGLYNYPGADDECGVRCGADFRTRFDNANLWLLAQMDALFTSIYLQSTNATGNQAFVDSQLLEARRVRSVVHQRIGRLLPIYTYTWAEYYVGIAYPWEQLLNAADVETTFVRPSTMWGAAGSVLWGDGEQARNLTLCGDGKHSLSAWVNATLGPAVLRATEEADWCAKARCNGHGRCWGGGTTTTLPARTPPPSYLPQACDCDAGWRGRSCATQSSPWANSSNTL